jgi:hypothetical protein
MMEDGDQVNEEGSAGVELCCPECGEVLRVAVGVEEREEMCPVCGGVFVVPGEGRVEERREEGLDSLRMRHVIVQRRAAARSRTYMLLGAGVCVVGAVQLVIMGWQEGRAGGVGRAVAFGVCALAAAWGAWWFWGRAAYWAGESRGAAMPEPEGEPDFSTLGDGSQKARDLEDVR